jgi:DNA-binding beta-propeller fold protein YncE
LCLEHRESPIDGWGERKSHKSTIPAYAIAAAGNSTLVITTPSTASNLGNDVLVVDPSTGNVESAVFAGSEPSLVALSPDGSQAYTYLSGTGTLARISLAAHTRDLVFSGDFTGQERPVAVLGHGSRSERRTGGQLHRRSSCDFR